MTLKLGALDVIDVHLGALTVSRVMLGAEQVWPTGPLVPTGRVLAVEGPDTASIVGTVALLDLVGVVAVIEAGDLASIVGNSTAPAGVVVGAVAVVEVDDLVAVVGAVSAPVYTGTIVGLEDDDLAALVGTSTAPVYTGTIVAVEADDTSTIAGTFGTPTYTGVVAVTEADDVPVIAGTFGPTGIVAATEATDVPVISGTFTASGGVFYADAFNRANTTPTGIGGTGLGAGWASDVFAIASNTAYKYQGGNDWARFLTALPGPDQWVEADVTGISASAFMCVDVRLDATLANCYFAYVDPGSGLATISKIVSGGFSAIATGTNVGTADCKLRLEVEGTALRLYRNGTLVCSTTDTSVSTGSYAGLNTNFSANTAVHFDNFRCGALPYTP